MVSRSDDAAPPVRPDDADTPNENRTTSPTGDHASEAGRPAPGEAAPGGGPDAPSEVTGGSSAPEPEAAEWRQEVVEHRTTDVEREDAGAPEPQQRAPWDPAKIRVTTKPWSLRQVIDDITDRTIDLAPDFQRPSVWNKQQRSRLVESILLGIPLPAFYFSADAAGLLQVVDGVQRLNAIFDFAIGKFALEHLEYLLPLNGKKFADLDAPLRRRFHQTQIFVNVIEPGTPVVVKFNIFKRINTTAEPLTPQEIRHALSQDRSRKFLRRMASSELFHRATGGAFREDLRMAGHELALRFVAFTLDTDLSRYEAAETADDFLSACALELDDRAAVSDTRLGELEQLFERAMMAACVVFGDHAFRKWPLTRASARRAPLNRALFDSWSTVLAEHALVDLEPHKEAIVRGARAAFDDLEYDTAISVGTAQLARVRRRIAVARQILREAGV